MNFGIFELLKLAGALGFFIYGMKVMSEGIQRVAGDKLRSILARMTSSRLSGILTGFLTTSLIQSSSATTVMVVSFANAGLLTLKQAIGVIMGANIGTTVTAILLTVFGFSKFSISDYTLPILAIGFPMLFLKNPRLRYWGEFLIGFSLLFMGLDALKNSVPELSEELLAQLQSLTDMGYLSVVLFIAFGALLTIVVQSSSAAIALTLVMCEKGWIPFEMAAAIVLGENIGTTITANIAAVVGNNSAKRAARAHLIFNLIGVAWMLIVFYGYVSGIDKYMVYTKMGSPFEETSSIKWALTLFHISFNILNTAILVWFIPQIVNIVTKILPDKLEEQEFKLTYLGPGPFGTAELSAAEIKVEIAEYAKIIDKMAECLRSLLETSQSGKHSNSLEKIRKYEELTDNMERQIAHFIENISMSEISQETAKQLRGYIEIIHDFERIGDIFYQISKDFERKITHGIEFTDHQKNQLIEMLDLLDQSTDIMLQNLQSEHKKIDLKSAREQREKMQRLNQQLREQHLDSIEDRKFEESSGMIFKDIFYAITRVEEHIYNVTKSMCETSDVSPG